VAVFFYVRNDGTAAGDDGRYTTRETGDFDAALSSDWGAKGFAANDDYFYGTIALAFGATTPPAAGDFIFVSNTHATTNTLQTWGGSVFGNIPVMIFSVDDANCDQYSAGAAETTSSGADIRFDGHCYIRGMTLTVGNDLDFLIASQAVIEDSTIDISGSGDLINLDNDGASITLINTTVNFSSTGAFIFLRSATSFEWYGGSVTGSVPDNLFGGSAATNGGMFIRVIGVDLSLCSGNILGSFGGDVVNDDTIEVEFRSCALHATATKHAETFLCHAHNVLFIGCGSTAAEAEYQFHVATIGGEADDDLRYRDESLAFASGEKVSILADTNANASLGSPFSFELPARFAELATATTDTLRIYFTSDTTLDDTDVWAEVVYPDGTNKHKLNYLSNQNADPLLASGTEFTDDSGNSTWKAANDTDLALSKEYFMDLDTSGDVGADGVPVVRIYVALPDILVLFDTELDQVP